MFLSAHHFCFVAPYNNRAVTVALSLEDMLEIKRIVETGRDKNGMPQFRRVEENEDPSASGLQMFSSDMLVRSICALFPAQYPTHQSSSTTRATTDRCIHSLMYAWSTTLSHGSNSSSWLGSVPFASNKPSRAYLSPPHRNNLSPSHSLRFFRSIPKCACGDCALVVRDKQAAIMYSLHTYSSQHFSRLMDGCIL